jgi:D-beta-D-heptose 7-phosphate kinase/D-beta-D-heptose 1-phosphate adenosyltransferase
MIDEYYKVKITRISPEHPVPVMACQNDVVFRPGGAANVAYQFKHLNVEASLICFPDKNALNVFRGHNINCICAGFLEDCSLPIKRRYLDNGIQVAPRHDFEKKLCNLSFEQINKYFDDLYLLIKKDIPDVAILSDYDKGFFCNLENKFLNVYKGKKTIVDPKFGPLEKWKGCTIFKPNSKEAYELTGYVNWQDQAKYLQDLLECQAVVITFGGEKVAGVSGGEQFLFTPNKKVNVESVIGAGDCFAAFFATAIGHNFTPIEAAEIAWNAGSIYVQQRMNRPVVPAELSCNKIVAPEDLNNRDFKLVFTNGCFDIVHKGHIETLKFCKTKGDKVVVALNSDDSIRRLKGDTRPIMSLENRIAVISSFEFVDFVVVFEDHTPLEIIKKINPDVIVKGGDYVVDDIVGADIVREVYVAPQIKNLSTTKILEDWIQIKKI